MSSVEVVNEQGSRGGNPLNGTYFADSFNRADQPFFTGDKWYTVYSGESGFVGVQVEAMINVAANNLVLNNNAGGGGTVFVYMIPIPLNYYNLFTFAQFSEAEFRGDTAVGALQSQLGPCVFANVNSDVAVEGSEMYGATTFFDGVNKTFYAARGNIGAVNVQPGTAPIINVGDVLRIECTPSASSNRVVLKLNGVTQVDVNDNNVNRPRFGMPGFNFGFQSNGVSSSWRNFKCGVLPQKSTTADFPL